ncbi:MAG TPA: hypothetical protein VG870_07185 [Chitinophagaceae bacterium]|nr:hypothetical protein [Chitinophagaceae bacterium]
MKRLLTCLLVVSATLVTRGQDPKHDFTTSLGLDGGVYLSDASLIHAGLRLDVDYHAEKNFSIYGSIGYKRLFTFHGDGSVGIATAYLGPRFYFSPRVFLGAGVGFAFVAGDGESAGAFSYHPHLGLLMHKVMLTLGYVGITDSGVNAGFADLGILVRLGKKAS